MNNRPSDTVRRLNRTEAKKYKVTGTSSTHDRRMTGQRQQQRTEPNFTMSKFPINIVVNSPKHVAGGEIKPKLSRETSTRHVLENVWLISVASRYSDVISRTDAVEMPTQNSLVHLPTSLRSARQIGINLPVRVSFYPNWSASRTDKGVSKQLPFRVR